ncbi:ABC transporter substrate-binding protein [Brachybacterium sp. AOP43-C2-M15]|uniref:ABC transporter substrate-binding protein n=1 Tax=Brachybacterium sp. AOP43-C2-M15 TaxID=3457661 RepID=UPI004034BC6B
MTSSPRTSSSTGPRALASRRSVLGAGALGASALTLAACGGSGDGGEGGGDGGSGDGPSLDLEQRGPITLARGKDTTGQLNEFLERWNSEHPDEEVTLIELPESADEQRAQMINNAQAQSDAYTILSLDVVWTAEFAANQWVIELPEDHFPLDGILPGALETGKYFDKLYAVPYATNAQLLFYRKDLLEEAGHSEPPVTFEEMWQMIEDVQAKDDSILGYGAQFSKYEGLTCQASATIRSNGGDLFDAEGAPQADSAEAVEAIETIRAGFEAGHIPEEALTYKEEETRQAFQDGRLLFQTNWPYVWELAQAEDGSSEVNGKIGVTLVPGVKEAGASTLGGANYAISAFAQNAGTALDFIAFMTEFEQQRDWMLNTTTPTAMAEVYEDPDIVEAFDFIDQLRTSIENGVVRPQVVKYGDVTQAIQDAVYGAISGETEVQDAMEGLQERLTELGD